MKKRIITILTATFLVLQLCSTGMVAWAATQTDGQTYISATSPADAISDTLDQSLFAGAVVEYEEVDAASGRFKLNVYSYNRRGLLLGWDFIYNTDKLVLANKTTGATVSVSAMMSQAIEGALKDAGELGNAVDITSPDLGVMTFPTKKFDKTTGKATISCGGSTNIADLCEYFGWVDNEYTLAMTQQGVGYQLYSLHCKVINPADLETVSHNDFQLDVIPENGRVTGIAVYQGDDVSANRVYFKDFPGDAASSTTDLTTIGVADIAAPAVGGNVPVSTTVTFGVGSGTAPDPAAASIAWTKGGAAYNESTFQDYSTAYTATFTVDIPEGCAYAQGSTAVTLGGQDAGPVTVNGNKISFTKTYTTAAAPGAEPVAPPKPADPDSGVVKEEPSVTTGQSAYEFTYKSTGTGTPVMGKVTLKKKAGGAFDLNAPADAATVYQMTAAPQSGYKFTGWKKTTANFSLFALDENGIDTSSATIEGTAGVLSQYTPVFAEQSVVTADDPRLDQMTVSTADGKSILLRTDHKTDGFASDVTDYLLYLMPEAAGFDLNMVIATKEEDDGAFNSVVKVNGQTIAPTETRKDGMVRRAYAKTLETVNGTVTIAVTSGAKTTEYTITVDKIAVAPTIAMDITDKNSGVYGMDVSLQNTIANEFSFSLTLDPSVFMGFTVGAAELTNGDVSAALNGQLAEGSAFEVVKASYDSSLNTLSVVMAARDGGYVDCTAGTTIGTLEFRTSGGTSVPAADWAKLIIDADFSKSMLTDQRFTAFEETSAAFDQGLIRITVPDMMTIAGYLNSLMKADVQANVAAIHVKSGAESVTELKPDAERWFAGKVTNGEYTLEIVLPNYIRCEVAIGPENSVVGAIAMTAGDLNQDGHVDAQDRARLIELLYTSVQAGEVGDIDGDGRITGGDLGYLLANIGI